MPAKFGELTIFPTECDFCWIADDNGICASGVPATQAFTSDEGVVFTCDECAD